MGKENDIEHFRGLVGARLANKDNWLFVIAGSKKFVNFIADQPMPTVKDMLVITPHPVGAVDVAGHPELWVMMVAHPKATDPIEAKQECLQNAAFFRLLGSKKLLRPDEDIFILLEPKSPRWAGRLVGNYLEFIRTGEGAMEPPL